ncbi:hypothetical protein CBR_g23465 [Chara braunii]|uniref:Reverse transcriptase domain-containing protein n=1 Tax=Chara braunii TaxID=69332 RepID=A0A388L4A0_CHABU|nr:hypothetical protein CBR_g23465 [Chara braunii]|eukprot:GBG77139.1 hypothetical protein CBR_g23465 [Chara braunii]
MFEDSPPMVIPAKRTPRRSEQKKKDTNTPVRITRSRAKLKTKLSPLIDKFKKIPGQPSTVEKLRYRNQQMEDLRSLDALELQGICKDERVVYVGKIDAIFDIASHRTRLHFGEIEAIEVSSATELVEDEAAIAEEVVSGFSNWYNLKGFVPDFGLFDFQVCFGEKDDSSDRISVLEVNTVKRECDGMVLTPLDRNAGETLVMCPFVYYRAMMDSFVTNVGYRIVKDQEREVLAMVKMEVREEGLTKFARWDDKGSYGVSYVLPKHKDTSRFRPICPTFKEPMVKIGRVVAKALNHLLFQLPVDNHSNLQAVSSLAARLQRINRRIERGNREGVESASYDIKEMFNRLPHEDILEAVEWIDHDQRKGKLSVRVNTRGRGASFGKTTGADHRRQLDLFDILKFVRLELKHTYTYATGVQLRQVIGILMGKSTSLPLTCILCAYAECKFLNNLGVFRKRVFGIRLVDDVTLVTVGLSAQQRGAILDTFESCYPQNLVLKRSDTGSDTLHFLRMTDRIVDLCDGTNVARTVRHPVCRVAMVTEEG